MYIETYYVRNSLTSRYAIIVDSFVISPCLHSLENASLTENKTPPLPNKSSSSFFLGPLWPWVVERNSWTIWIDANYFYSELLLKTRIVNECVILFTWNQLGDGIFIASWLMCWTATKEYASSSSSYAYTFTFGLIYSWKARTPLFPQTWVKQYHQRSFTRMALSLNNPRKFICH